jgi:hypothetical protein
MTSEGLPVAPKRILASPCHRTGKGMRATASSSEPIGDNVGLLSRLDEEGYEIFEILLSHTRFDAQCLPDLFVWLGRSVG